MRNKKTLSLWSNDSRTWLTSICKNLNRSTNENENRRWQKLNQKSACWGTQTSNPWPRRLSSLPQDHLVTKNTPQPRLKQMHRSKTRQETKPGLRSSQGTTEPATGTRFARTNSTDRHENQIGSVPRSHCMILRRGKRNRKEPTLAERTELTHRRQAAANWTSTWRRESWAGTDLRAREPSKSAALLAAGAWTGAESNSKRWLREQKTKRQEGIGTET
jgi:hypothetical protein